MKSVFEIIDGYQQQVIDYQKTLVTLQALAPEYGGEGEQKKSEAVKEMLAPLKPGSIQDMPAPDDRVPGGYRPNFLVRFPGVSSERTIWIMAHLDVVPAGDRALWRSDPFSLKVDGDRLIGRGVEDNHQGLISALLALSALHEAGIQPAYNIGLAIVSDEETGSEHGLHYLMQHHRDAFQPQDYIIVPDAGEEQGIQIEVAEKSILWVRFQVSGKQCHASTPDLGINAHRASAHLIVLLDQLHDIFSAQDPVFDPPGCTFEPTKKDSNVPNINTIPGEDIFYLDCRILPLYPLDQVKAKIREMAGEIEKRFGTRIEMSFPQHNEAAPPTPADAPVVKALARAIEQIKNKKAETIGIGGGTVASFFRENGFPTAVWSTILDTAHQPNETALISNTLVDAKIFAHVFMDKE